MTWLPWLLLLALGAATLWGYSTVATHVRWARRALLTKGHTPRPQGWLVHKLQLEELFDAIERRADGEGELRAKSARRIEALLAPLTIAGHKLGLERALVEPAPDDVFEAARSAAWASADAEEGRTAFLAKRPPNFTGS